MIRNEFFTAICNPACRGHFAGANGPGRGQGRLNGGAAFPA
jgi:hypothetical protein